MKINKDVLIKFVGQKWSIGRHDFEIKLGCKTTGTNYYECRQSRLREITIILELVSCFFTELALCLMVWDPESIRSLSTDLGRYFDCFKCVWWGEKEGETSDGIVFSKKGMASKSIQQLTAATGGLSSRFPMTDLSSSTLANLGAEELGWISLILTLIFRLAVSSSGKQYEFLSAKTSLHQVWSLTQLSSVDFSQSKIGAKKVPFQQTHNQGLR